MLEHLVLWVVTVRSFPNSQPAETRHFLGIDAFRRDQYVEGFSHARGSNQVL